MSGNNRYPGQENITEYRTNSKIIRPEGTEERATRILYQRISNFHSITILNLTSFLSQQSNAQKLTGNAGECNFLGNKILKIIPTK
jgi:hypothetical protein